MTDLFDVIYADPPWQYGNRPGRADGKYGDIDHHYPTMPTADICALDIPAARNAVLYLWATAPLLPDALDVMAAWGFEYRSNAVWDKQIIGIGYWFRGQHEHLLVGVRGDWSPPSARLRAPSVYTEPKQRHSRKPDHYRRLIAAWWPDARRLEMFCRYPSPGWSVWGNQVDSSLALLPAERYDPEAAKRPGQGALFGGMEATA